MHQDLTVRLHLKFSQDQPYPEESHLLLLLSPATYPTVVNLERPIEPISTETAGHSEEFKFKAAVFNW